MTMSWVWTGIVIVSLLSGLYTGQGEAVAAAVMEGAQQGLELCMSIGGMLCLWSGVMEVMGRCGLTEKMAGLLSPLLRVLFRDRGRDRETREAIAANLSANLLGLGNAATPLGLKAIARMHRAGEDSAGDDMCTLVVCNAASLQLIPTTVAAVRAAEGCKTPFDILPAVWLSSAAALCAGLLMCRIFRRVWRR